MGNHALQSHHRPAVEVLSHLIELGDIGDGDIERCGGSVVLGEVIRPFGEERAAHVAAEAIGERNTEPLLPCLGGGYHLGLEARHWHVDVPVVTHPDREVETRRVCFAERESVVDRGPTETLLKQLLQVPPESRIEPISRHHHEQRHVATEEIAPDEQANALVFLQFDEPDDALAYVLRRHRKELVGREAVEELDDSLVQVSALDEILRLDDSLQFAAQQGNRVGRCHVRPGGEEADQTGFTDHGAVGPYVPNTDVVHLGATMNSRHGVGLRDNQKRADLVAIPERSWDLRERHRPGIRGFLIFAEHTEP